MGNWFTNMVHNDLNILSDPFGTGNAKKAAQQQQDAQSKALGLQQGLYDTGNQQITQAGDSARGALGSYGQQGMDAMGAAYDQQNSFYGQAGGALQGGERRGRDDLASIAALGQYGQQAVATPLGSGYEQSPGYQFQLQQGQQALDRQQSASGGRFSGAALKAASQFSQGLANQDYQQYVGNDLSQRQMMMQLGQTGYNAQNQMANMSNQYGQNMASLYGNQAGAAQNYGQNQASLYANLGNAFAGSYGNQMQAQLGQNQMLGNAYSNYAGFAGMGQQQQANSKAAGLGVLAPFAAAAIF